MNNSIVSKERVKAAKGNYTELNVRVTIHEESLGTASGDPSIHDTYIASKAPDAKSREEEVEAVGVDEVIEKSMTVYPKLKDGTPFLFDYQIKGFFKDAAKFLKKVPYCDTAAIKAYKQTIDGLIFVYPRKIPWHIPEGESMGTCQRPLRASTPQGERVALANSETVPAESYIEFKVRILDGQYLPMVVECLDYGILRGLGQWRNSGKGVFTWEEVADVKELPKDA